MVSAAPRIRILPTSVEPVNEIARTRLSAMKTPLTLARRWRCDLEHARGQAGIVEDPTDLERGQRGELGGLEDHRAAGGQAGAELAEDLQRREVPRRDAGGDPDRLLERDDPLGAGRGRDGHAVDPAGLLGEPVDEADAVLDLADGLGDRLALLAAQQLGELVDALLEDPGGAAHDRCALDGRRRAPARPGPRPRRRSSPGRRPRWRRRPWRRRSPWTGSSDVEGGAVGGVPPLAVDEELGREVHGGPLGFREWVLRARSRRAPPTGSRRP